MALEARVDSVRQLYFFLADNFIVVSIERSVYVYADRSRRVNSLFELVFEIN